MSQSPVALSGVIALAMSLSALSVAVPSAARADPSAHTIHVYKTPWCGCCGAWAAHMKGLGYAVETTELDDLSQLRRQAGVPDEVRGCHTAVVEGYVLEGHVPPEAMTKLLDERPRVRGIAVPGMPEGSIGMGNDPQARYDVLAFGGAAEEGDVFYRAGR